MLLDQRKLKRWTLSSLLLLGSVLVVTTTLLIWSIFRIEGSSENGFTQEKPKARIAFGSSTSHDYSPQPIWVQGVIPSDPDVWIWLGDMAYMDEPRVNCDALPGHPQCNCSSDWLHESPHYCMTGSVEHALSRVQAQLANPDYAQFLAYMCPEHRAKGLHPPIGSDLSVCPKSIYGTYDDHDYGWKHGNKRLPNKDDLKQVFLDGIGEPKNSPRRKQGRGIEWKYTINKESEGHEVDIILLDERYNRDPLPCHIRRTFCEDIVLKDVHHKQYYWCVDFLGGESGKGSCCDKDEIFLYGWCLQESSKANPYWSEVCNPASSSFGKNRFKLEVSGHLMKIAETDESSGHDGSSFCEVLGQDQRLWLEEQLLNSDAPLKLLVSSSVILGNPLGHPCEDVSPVARTTKCVCSGDDWECYKPSQINLLQLVSRARGCVVILTGDSLYSDIRVLRPGRQPYGGYFEGVNITYPLFQVMASGLTTSSTKNFSCEGIWSDPLGFRDHGECNFVRGPSFGMVQMEWEQHNAIARLQIRDGMSGKIQLESTINLQTCT
ncbi:hypothetical protein O6H91_17G049000 [Diphasiastrum complanatum]|uniref:Uncharacterized protein n=1 Tax=Diphasiastrum complanatum TaxID=34168 RepID=A0ACC2B6I8_DIPCM|nr:hypothetical protein O6H91_17G049000 [Diphasiastrum complanatum]